MKSVLVTLIALVAVSAKADGFKCEALDGSLTVKVYNHTAPEVGTRSAAIMVVSDPSISFGRKTIATFKDAKRVLANKGAHYFANVDLRVTEVSRKGELIAGTKLGELDTLELIVDFSYGEPTAQGETADAALWLTKRSGQKYAVEMSCARYLKN